MTWWSTLSSRLATWPTSWRRTRASGLRAVRGSSLRPEVSVSTYRSSTSGWRTAKSRLPRRLGWVPAPPVRSTGWARTAPAASATSMPRSRRGAPRLPISRFVFFLLVRLFILVGLTVVNVFRMFSSRLSLCNLLYIFLLSQFVTLYCVNLRLIKTSCALVADVGPSVVCSSSVVCCLSRGHISKTKQNGPIVTMEHYIEVSSADTVATIRSFPDAVLGRHSGFK